MLSIVHVLADLPDDTPVIVEERRGQVLKLCSRRHFTPEAVAALNSAAEATLEGGQWFQLWKGEIVSMASPEDENGSGKVARLHRGQVAHKAS